MVRQSRCNRAPSLVRHTFVALFGIALCTGCAGYTPDRHDPELDTPEYHSRADVERLVEPARISCDNLTEEQQNREIDGHQDSTRLVTCTKQGHKALHMHIYASPARAREAVFVFLPDKRYYLLRGSNWIATFESEALLQQLKTITGGVAEIH